VSSSGSDTSKAQTSQPAVAALYVAGALIGACSCWAGVTFATLSSGVMFRLDELTGTRPRDFRLIIRASYHYQPFTAILYTSRMGTVARVIQADSV